MYAQKNPLFNTYNKGCTKGSFKFKKIDPTANIDVEILSQTDFLLVRSFKLLKAFNLHDRVLRLESNCELVPMSHSHCRTCHNPTQQNMIEKIEPFQA